MWIYEQTKPEEALSLLPQTVSLPVQKAESALPTAPATAPEIVEKLPQKEPCIPSKRHATRDCWLLAAAFLLGCTAAGVLQAVCDARQAELLQYYLEAWQRLFAPGICRVPYSFSARNIGSRPCGQPVSGIGAVCPWASDDLWQHDVVRFGQRVAYGTGLRRRRMENGTSGAAVDRLAGGSSKRLSVLFRGLCFAGQQPDPRLLLPQASRRTSSPRGTGTAGTISADHGGVAAAVRRGGRAFVSWQSPVNGILFLRVLAQCVTITKDHNK